MIPPAIPTTRAVPRTPTVAAFGLKDADPAAEPLHVISWLDTSLPVTSIPPFCRIAVLSVNLVSCAV